jgi:DNA-binding XRE family transcriptional regulator
MAFKRAGSRPPQDRQRRGAASGVLDELREEGMQAPGFREGYEARDALIRLGDMLRGVREAAGYTQEELAERTGMAQPTISRLESGFGPRGPEMDTIMRFVHGCNAQLVVSVECEPAQESDQDELKAAADLGLYDQLKTVM